MRDLTEEELKLAPAGCDHYNIIDGEVYFTDVLGIDVFDIDGYEINNCIMDNKVFVKSRPLPKKPFDISEHEFSDKDLVASIDGETIELEVTYQQWGGHINGYSEEEKTVNINKQDAIAIAKALGVTAEDLK